MLTSVTNMPATDAVERMRTIWCRLLDHNEFGPTDSFFDVGGHSLLATELAIEIENEFAVSVPAEAIFDHQSIAALCQFIGHLGAVNATIAPGAAVAHTDRIR